MHERRHNMACEHKRLRCTDGVFYCLDCGAKVDTPHAMETAADTAPAPTEDAERVTSASGRKIGFNAEKPKRRTRKGATKA